MTINRRRAPSSQISSEKKISGHSREYEFSGLIEGSVISGTQKGDVKKNNDLFSVKGGKKWQIFLYSYDTISNSTYLNVLKSCLDVFPSNYEIYLKHREDCISFREELIKEKGRNYVKFLENDDFKKIFNDPQNSYMNSKFNLSDSTKTVAEKLKDKSFLKNFLRESIFNNYEVKYLSIKDSTFKKDLMFKVFDRENVINILSKNLFPSISKAGRVPEDFNVEGQKVLLTYERDDGTKKNIVEIEIRNDSSTHYRQVRFNMYSHDALSILLNKKEDLKEKSLNDNVLIYGDAINGISD